MKIMEEITSGNTHPRLLEVMGQLQDKMANITKTQANYILFLEDTYKRLNSEEPSNSNDVEIKSDSNEGQFFVSVGTKNMIENLPEIDKSEIDIEESDGSLVDPRNKQELLKERNIDVTIDDEADNDGFIDVEEII